MLEIHEIAPKSYIATHGERFCVIGLCTCVVLERIPLHVCVAVAQYGQHAGVIRLCVVVCMPIYVRSQNYVLLMEPMNHDTYCCHT